jgi:putative ABC transport system permease protein
MYRIPWNNFKRRKFHVALTVIFVAIAAALIFTTLILGRGVTTGIESSLNQMGADILVTPDTTGEQEDSIEQILFIGILANIYMRKDLVDEIRRIDGVQAATAQFFTQTLDASCCSVGGSNRIVGFDQKTDFALKPLIEASVNSSSPVKLASYQAIAGGNAPAPLGEKITLLGKVFTITDCLKPVGGSVDTTFFIPIDTARQLAANNPELKGYWRENRAPSQLISAVLVKVINPQRINYVAFQIEYRFNGVKATVSSEVLRSSKEQVKSTILLITVLVSILWFVILVALIGQFLSRTMVRKREFGLLRALGASRPDIFRIITVEALLSTVLGGLAGLLLGSGLVYGGILLIKSRTAYPFLLPSLSWIMMSIALTILFPVLVGLLASFYPAYHCAVQDPVRAISEGELE